MALVWPWIGSTWRIRAGRTWPDADTGRATWLSRDAEPAPCARKYVTEHSENPEVTAGLADGPVWLGPAPAVRAPDPEVSLRSRQGDTIELHVSSPRSASTVVLQVDHQVDEVIVIAPGADTHRPPPQGHPAWSMADGGALR
ncbi:MAG: hypothetical protein DLM62_02855 [Pseudonocardiales bacterium]|nr:MAG: hypothetical protein DLM62_02855 [Pseudonocardiales bacterium]